jgi:hypothetical protein
MQLAASFAPQFQGQPAPTQVASLDPSAGMPEAATAIERTEPGSGSVDSAVAAPNYDASLANAPVVPNDGAIAAMPAGPAINAPTPASAPVEVAGGGGRPSEPFNPYSNEAIVKAMSSPHLSAGQRSVMQAMLQQQQARQQAAREEQTWMRRQ